MAERARSSAETPLEAGRKIDRLADAVQYVFSAPSATGIASDSPAELIVDGLPVEAVVVSAEGLDVTVSVSTDLGDRIPRATLRRDPTHLLRRLIARVQQAAGTPNPAGDRLLGDAAASGAPEAIDDPLLDEGQRAAVGSSLGRDITFIFASPGTKKTQTIGSIGAHLYRRQRSVLLVSHTNRAVDQALVEIADRLGGEVDAGSVLRVGVPTDQRLRERDDLLVEAVVWRRQAELRERKASLRAEQAAIRRRIAESERLMRVAAWAGQGQAVIADLLLRLDALDNAEAGARRLAGEVARRASGEAGLASRLAEAQETVRAATEAQRVRAELPWLAAELDAARAAVAVADEAVSQARWELHKALELEPLVARERALPPLAEQRRAVDALALLESEAKKDLDAAAEARGGVAASGRRLRGGHSRRRARDAAARARLDGIRRLRRDASAVLAELEQLDRHLAPWRKLVPAEARDADLERREAERALSAAAEMRLEQRRTDVERQLARAADAVEGFRERHAVDPSGLIARIEPRLAELRRLRERLGKAERAADELREALDAGLAVHLAAIETLGLGDASSLGTAEERFALVALAQSEARRLASHVDAAALEAQIAVGWRELAASDETLARIGRELEATRRIVIADAKLVATTLARVCAWDELQDRRFDTVIIDEASMAPTPALWVAALLADANLVVIGEVRDGAAGL